MIRLARLCTILLSLLSLGSAPASAQADAAGVVEGLHDVLLVVMKQAHATDAKDRYAHLSAPLKKSFHLALMARVTCGAYWRKASALQKAGLVEAFERFSIGTYARRFNGFSGEKFETISAKPGPSGTMLVATRILRPDDEPVGLTYVLKPFKEAWRIVDVLVAGGISELAVRKSENQAVLKNEGIDALITTLNGKADDLIAP